MIRNVILRVTDLARALDFYERGLQGVVVAHNARRIVLDFDTATLELHEVPDAVDNQWSEDDAVVGFRHIGFKVPSVDRALVALKALGFHARLGPVDLERAGIRAVLLYDADHVNIETGRAASALRRDPRRTACDAGTIDAGPGSTTV